MARVKRAEVSEEALFADVQKSAESTIATIKTLNVELNEAAKVLSKDLSAALVKDTATLAKFNKAIAEANKLKQTATILDKQQIKAEEQKAKAAINAERIAREKLKTQREEVRNSEQLKKQKDAQANAEERAAVNAERIAREKLKTQREEVRNSEQMQKQKDTQAKAEERAAINAERIAREKLKTQREEVRNSEQMQKQKDAQAKAEERAAKAAIDEANAYKILSNRTRDQKNESKRLAAEMIHLAETGRRNSKEYRALASTYRQVTREAQKGDVALKKIDATVGDNFRNVGAYKTGLQGLTRGLMQLAGGFSLMQGIRGSISVLTEFDEKLADIQKTTGLSKQGAKDVSMSLLKIDTKSSVTELQELASAAGRLGFTAQKDIVSFATAADKVFVALGDDLDGTAEEIATSLGKMASVFGLEQEFGIGVAIEKVGSGMNQLSASSKASAPAILDFTQRMAGMASVLEIEDVQALGALFDEAGQSVEVSASTLSKLLPDLSADYKRFAEVANMTPEAFKKIAEESPVEALKAVAVGAKSNEKGLFALTETLESYGIEGARAAGIVGVLTNNTERLTELQEINREAIAKNTSITDEFNTKNETLGATWDKLVKRVQTWVIEGDSAIGMTNGLKNAMAFLGDNFDEVVSGVGKLIKIYVTYKLITNDNVKATASFLMNLGKMEGVSTKAGESLKKIGGALKGIGWAVAIAALWELGNAFWNAVSGARALERETAKIKNLQSIAGEQATGVLDEINKKRQKQLTLLEQELRLYPERAKQIAEQKKLVIASSKEELNAAISTVEARRTAYQKEFFERKAALKEFQKNNAEIAGVDLNLSSAELAESLGISSLLPVKKRVLLEMVKSLEDTKAAVEATQTKIDIYKESVESLDGELVQATVDQKTLGKAVVAGTKATKEAANEVGRLSREREKGADRLITELPNYKRPIYEEDLSEFTQIEKEKRLELLKTGATDEQIQEEMLEVQIDNLEQRLALAKELGRETIDIETELEEKKRERKDKAGEEGFLIDKKWIDLTADYLIKKSDERIAQLDKEIDAHQSLYDHLAQLAQEGNISAKESLAEQQSIINEANKKKIDEEKRKQRIELAATAYASYQGNVESGSANPLADTIRDISLLQAFINSLPAFEEGVENTGQNGQGVDGRGGFLSVLHPYERVVPKEENAKIGDLSNDELARIAHDYQTGKLISFGESAMSFGGWDTSALLNKLDAVEKAIKSQPVVDWDIHGITTEVLSLVRKERNGNTTTYNRYRVD